ncbi:MAG TPA: alpha/beta hydrolase [Candidatus Limnocylindrales bacterium]|nr:alpha/beta hydrolase [Candidatus Limnocylindrales bacterium]
MTDGTSPTIWIDVAGGRLAAQDEGPRDGSPILLVHSAIVNRRSWDPVVPHLTGAGYRVIRYDMRGFGESTTEKVEFVAHQDLLAVLDFFGVRKAAVAGNSMGAHFAIDAVLAAPDRFTALMWVGGGINGFDKDVPPAEDELFEAEGAAEEAGDWDLAAELDTRIWVDGWIDGAAAPATRVDPEVRAAIKQWDRELLEPGREYGDRIKAAPAIDRLDQIEVPTLVAIGDLDTSGTRAAAEVLAEKVDGARLVHFPKAAHIIGMEAPAELAAAMLDLLAPLPRWA